MKALNEVKICIIGLGYVGLPLAVEFGKKFPSVGFDLNHNRITELKKGTDSTLEVSEQELTEANQLTYTSSLNDIQGCNVYIVAVPTPIDSAKRPDLSPLIGASSTVAECLLDGVCPTQNGMWGMCCCCPPPQCRKNNSRIGCQNGTPQLRFLRKCCSQHVQ